MAKNKTTKYAKYNQTIILHVSKLSIIRNLNMLSILSKINLHANFHFQEFVDIFIRSWRELGN